MEKFFGAARKTFSDAAAVFREAAHDATYDLRDNALRGFGLPKLVTSAASFTVAGCAAVGTLAITCEMISKMHVRRVCKNCNGFGGFKCKTCSGEGQVQYSTNTLTKAKRSAIESLANDVLEGKEELTYYPPGYNAGYPLPYGSCPTCDGAGVATCQVCKGGLSRPQLSFQNLMDVPWKTWNAHLRTHPPQNRRLSENVKDPELAAFLLYERDEMETGVKYDEDTKARLMASYLRDLEYDGVRDEVAMRRPGWEHLQEALHILDPDRAKRDPVVIQDVPHYKALKRIETEVESMEVPPRPAEFTDKYQPRLRERYGGKVDAKALSISEIRTLVEVRENLMEQVLDAAWRNEWRQRKVSEVVEEKIGPYIEAEESGKLLTNNRRGGLAATGGPSESAKLEERKQSDAKAGSKKSDKSPQKVDKKKERQERLARQAAEREAALTKAKKT